MNLLLELYKSIINESVSTESIDDSIENRYQVVINYDGDPEHGVAPGLRTIQAYAYGLTKAGNPVIRAFQPYGDTASNVPAWKFFRVDRITSWKPTYAITNTPAQGFNPSGDKSMSTVYSIINFSNEVDPNNASGPKQTFTPVGKLDNIDDILRKRNQDISKNKEYNKQINTPANKLNKQKTEPKISGDEETKTTKLQEPQVTGQEQNNTLTQPETNEPNETDNNQPNIKTSGDNELDKIKDLNKRLDNVRKIDLNNIPKK